MSDAEQPYQLHLDDNHASVILREAVQSADWGQLEAFGNRVIAELQKQSRPSCLMDLTQLTYMSSAMVALVVRIWKGVQAEGGRMVVACGHPLVLEVISLAGLNKVWEIVPDAESAYRKLGRKPPRNESGEPAAGVPNQSSRGPLVVGIVGLVLVLLVVVLVQFSESLPENIRNLLPWNHGGAAP